MLVGGLEVCGSFLLLLLSETERLRDERRKEGREKEANRYRSLDTLDGFAAHNSHASRITVRRQFLLGSVVSRGWMFWVNLVYAFVIQNHPSCIFCVSVTCFAESD